MGDTIRNRTLVLRVLVPGLEARLSDKMKEAEEAAARRVPPSSNTGQAEPKAILSDLEGVTCEPTKDHSTLWNFHCDGATYPARLVNLPCPVELHKTHDHAMYYKCVNIAQILIVYEDEMALEEAEAVPKSEGFPSYLPSGLTPPMRRAVERFEAREHKAVAPPKHEVGEVEIQLQGLMDRITKDAAGRTKKLKNPAPVSHKVVEEIVEDIVDYEPWMDDHGRSPFGIEFDDKHVLCTKHPELWLDPKEIAEIRRAEAEKEQEDAAAAAAIAAVTKNKGSAKKDPTKKKKKKAPEKDEGPSAKKGIPAKKNIQEVDHITQAASQMSAFIDPDDLFGDEFNDDFFTFGEDGDPLADLTEHNIS